MKKILYNPTFGSLLDSLLANHEKLKKELLQSQESDIETLIVTKTYEVVSLEGIMTWINPRDLEWEREREESIDKGIVFTKRKPINGSTIYKIAKKIQEKYNVHFLFIKEDLEGDYDYVSMDKSRE